MPNKEESLYTVIQGYTDSALVVITMNTIFPYSSSSLMDHLLAIDFKKGYPFVKLSFLNPLFDFSP